MNVTQLSLLVSQYGRANYLKTEIMNLLRYVRALAPNKKAVALTFMDEARELAYTELGESLPPTLPEGSVAVADNTAIAVKRSTGTAVGGNAQINVADGELVDVTLPAATALAVAGAQTGITVTGTYTTGVSFTVANGAITGITLS